MCPRDPFHRFCYSKNQLSTSRLKTVIIVGGGDWPCHLSFAEKHYQYTQPTRCLIARALLCDEPSDISLTIKYPCGVRSSELFLKLEPGMNIIVSCEDNIIYDLEVKFGSASYVINPRNTPQRPDTSYRYSDYPIPPYWTVLHSPGAPSLVLLSRLALGEQYVSQSLPAYGELPRQAANIQYHFIEQETQSNIIDY